MQDIYILSRNLILLFPTKLLFLFCFLYSASFRLTYIFNTQNLKSPNKISCLPLLSLQLLIARSTVEIASSFMVIRLFNDAWGFSSLSAIRDTRSGDHVTFFLFMTVWAGDSSRSRLPFLSTVEWLPVKDVGPSPFCY